MAKVDNITQMIRNAQADAIRKNGTANGQAIQNDTVKFLKKSINQQKAAAKPAAEPASVAPTVNDARTTRQKYDDARKAHADYAASDEHKKRLEDAHKTALQEAMQRLFSAGSTAGDAMADFGAKLPADAKEQQLKAQAEHYRQQMEAEESRKITDDRLKEKEALSDDDQAALEQYAVNQIRDQNLPVEMVGKMPTAQQEAAGLIEKLGKDQADKLAESFMRSENAELAEDVEEKAREQANKHGFLANAATIPVNLASGIIGTVGQLQGMARSTGQYETLDPNETGTIGHAYTEAVRGQTAQNIRGDGNDWLRNLAAIGYQGVMTIGDSAARIAASGGSAGISSAIAASGAFSSSLRQYSQQGASPEQAAAMAVVNAGLEYATEKLPTEEVLKLMKGGTGKGTIGKILSQAFLVEPTSEEVNLFAGVAAESLILGSKSDRQQKIGELVANGMSYEEAQAQYYRGLWREAAETYAVSAISGGAQSAGAAVLGGMMHGDGNGEEKNGLPHQSADWLTMTEEKGGPVAATAPQMDEGQQIMDAVAAELAQKVPQPEPTAPLTEEQQQIMDAVAETLGVQPAQQTTVKPEITPEEPAYHDEFEDWGNDPNREGVEDPLSDRSYSEVGKRSVNAYMYENPAVKPFYQEQAAWLLSELADSTKGERTYNEQLHYESGGEHGWSGTKRHTSESIAELLDQDGMTYDQIERGLNAIINDHGQENNAVSKRIEFIINDRLMNGYTDFYTGKSIPGNADYLELLRNQQSAPDVDTENTSADGGQDGGIRGTGAAESNFSGKPAYNATLEEDNAQADRRDDVRPMELPKRDIDGGDVSAVTGNVYGSKITPEEFASLMEEPTAKGDFTYAKITNDQATERAVDTIAQSGDWNTAYSQWVREVDRGAAGAEMTARGALLLNHAAQEGDKGKWLDILSDLQRLGTNTAQGLQAFRIIRTLSAPDRIEFAKMTVRKMVQDLKLGEDIEIDEALLDEYEQAQTEEERDAVLREIQQNVASQIPSTLLDKWTALRYMNMLGNLKTNVRNVMGNVGSSLVYRMKDQIAATMERVTGTQRTKSHTVDRDLLTLCKEDFEQFKDTVGSGGKYSDNLSSADQFRQGVMDQRQIFRNPLLEGYRKGTNWMMNNGIFGDEAFGRAAYARALAGFLKANGVTAEQFRQMVADKPKAAGTPKAIIPEGTKVKAADRNNFGTIQKYNKADNTYLVQFVSPQGHTANVTLSADILTPLGKKTDALGPVAKPEQKMEFVDYARAYAIREAQEATFHDNSALAGIVSNIQKATGVIGQGIMPFTKTPANVLTRAMEFSPLGIIDSTVKTIQARKNTEISGADIVNSWAKTMTGTGLFALGAAMMDQGLLSGGPDKDEEKAEFDQLNGHQNYALQLPDGTNYTIDWLTPAAMPMFMGAQFWDIANSGGEFSFADMEKVFTSIADPMIQMSMLQGLNDSLDGIKYAENNLGQFFINAAVSYLTQGLTNTLMGQIERSAEENRQTTYIDKVSGTPQWLQRQLGSASQKIPGWDYQQMDYRNAWGQTEQNEGGLLYNMLSPGYVSKEQSNAITKELYRLREATGENVFPQAVSKTVSYTDVTGTKHVNRALTKSELDTIQRVEGQTAMRLMAEMVMNEDYNRLTDDQRAKVIANVYEYAQEQGKKEALSGYHSEAAAWLRSIGDDAANALIRRAALGSINSAVSNTVDNIENGWAVTPAAQKELDSLYDSYDSMSPEAKKQILDDAISDTAKYLEIRSRGIATDQYLDVVGDIKGLEVEPNFSSIRDIQIREAIAGNDSLSTKEKDSVMRAYMPDYDPNAKSPQKTELKYDAIRKLGVTTQGYTDAYRDYLEASGSGKRRRTIAQYREKYGWDQATATKVYDIYAGSYKPWEE